MAGTRAPAVPLGFGPRVYCKSHPPVGRGRGPTRTKKAEIGSMHPRVFPTTLLVVGSIAYGLADRVGPPSLASAGNHRPGGWS
jgi:hypothetical protein